MQFDHFNITAPMALLDKVADFYCQVFDMRVGDRPNFTRQGYWLYALSEEGVQQARAILHLTEGEPSAEISTPSHLNHLAFALENRREFEQNLKRLSIVFRKSQVPGTQRIQLFFDDPTGLGLEVLFDE